MAFVGAINDKLRKFFSTQAHLLEGRKCYIGCSGNFTIEQIISRQCKTAEIYSNDVSLYSSVIGHMLTSRPFRAEVINEELRWMNNYMKGVPETVAAIMLMLEMLKFEKRKNPFAQRMWQAYQAQFQVMFGKTLEKVLKTARAIKIRDYAMLDVYDYYPRPEGVSIGFLPTYAGGYERLFKRLEESVVWDKPEYEMLTEERREETIRRMTEGDYILYDDKFRPGLPCAAKVAVFGKKAVFIYSNLVFRKGVFRRKLNETMPSYRLLMPEEEISPSDEVGIAVTDLRTINHYRNLFLSKKIEPGTGDTCLLVFVGDRLFGFLIFQVYSSKGDKTMIYLLSDFVVPSVRYCRLAKLLLMAVKCREVKGAIEGKTLRRYKGVFTTAFTDKPVSMKYRGVFKLSKRGKGFLNYAAEFEDTSLKEVLLLWMKKYTQS